MQQIADDFLKKLESGLSGKKADALFIVATIGLPGSGRTTVAKMLVEKLPGTVLVSSNSVRYLLREVGMPWGENVRQLLKYATQGLLSQGYGIILDGNAADQEDRMNIKTIADASGAKVFYLRINIEPTIAKEREKIKYDNPSWVSSFDDFRVNTTEKMLENISQRAELHKNLKAGDIPGLVGEIDNNGSLENLEAQVTKLADKIKEG